MPGISNNVIPLTSVFFSVCLEGPTRNLINEDKEIKKIKQVDNYFQTHLAETFAM